MEITCISSTVQHWVHKQSPQVFVEVFVGQFGFACSRSEFCKQFTFCSLQHALHCEVNNTITFDQVWQAEIWTVPLLNECLFCLQTWWKIGNVAFAVYNVLSCGMVKRLSVDVIIQYIVPSCQQSVIGNVDCLPAEKC